SRTEEIQASFSSAGSPTSIARAWLTGSSSQKTQRRHLGGRSSRLSSVMLASRRDTCHPCRSKGRDEVISNDLWPGADLSGTRAEAHRTHHWPERPCPAGLLGHPVTGQILAAEARLSRDHGPVTRSQVSRETMLALIASANWSTSAVEVSKAVIHRTM